MDTVKISPNKQYRITFEWVREDRVVITDWLSAEDAKGVIYLCNANPCKIHGIESKAA